MIDVCIVIHRNYDLLTLQLERWQHLKDFRLLVADNTPLGFRKTIAPLPAPHRLFTYDVMGDDGETHGGTIDFLLKQTESEHVGVCDSDFFVLHPDPWGYLRPHFQQGCQAVGAEAINKGWLKRNKNIEEHPDETRLYIPGYVAPCVFCCFFTRELALSETFVATHVEGRIYLLETGWRMRHKIYNEKIPCHVIPGFQHSGQEEVLWDSWFFGDPEDVFGLHLVAGSVQGLRESAVPALLDLHNKSNKELSQLKLKHSRQKKLLG